ncbi:MAG: PTPDL family protein [Verrucomicrobiota bacterium]
MKSKPILLALSSLALILPAMADTFTLKDGTTLEGVILKETPESYLLEVQVTKSIKDERELLKADVAKVSRERADLKAFEGIAKLVPTPDLLTDEAYGERITAVDKFLKDFPNSSKKPEAEKMLATLKQESAQVASGGVKMKGAIISPEEYQLDAYDLDARVEEARILRLVEERQYQPALRAWTDFLTKFKGTNSLTALIPTMRNVMKGQIAEAQQLIATLPERTKKRQVGLEQMSTEDRRVTERAIKDEDVAIAKLLESEKAAKIVWVTPSPFNRAALDEIVRGGDGELRRVEALVPPAPGKDSGRLWREAMALIQRGAAATEVAAAISAVRTAGIPADYLAILESAAKAKPGK